MHLTLKLVNGEVIQETVESNVCIIGRSAKCTVVIPHDGMSRQHCQIEVVDGEYFITDLGSTNGVFIDGQRIEAGHRAPYQTFLTLSFGAVQSLIIENEEPAGGSLNVGASARREMAREGATGITSFTKTKIMSDQNKTPTGAAQLKLKSKGNAKEAASKTQSMIINIIVALIIVGVAWWYMTKEEPAVDTGLEIPPEPIENQKGYDQF